MATGRLSISRGYERVEPVAPAPSAAPEYALAHGRLDVLERLARLFEQGALSAEEFAAEKSLILTGHMTPDAGPAPPREPSLVGRLFNWRLIPVGVVTGLALSFASQPVETRRFLDEALRVFGA